VQFFLWFLQENNPLKRISSINVIINLEKTHFSIKWTYDKTDVINLVRIYDVPRQRFAKDNVPL
jgi:hypothetical protein